MEKVIFINKKDKNLEQNNLISIPRSGQHMIENCLKYYFGLIKIDYSYCEFYNYPCGCNKIKCINNYLFQKNHDFGLKTSNVGIPVYDYNKYLFLFRNDLILQLEAKFRFLIKTKHNHVDSSKIKFLEGKFKNYTGIAYNNEVKEKGFIDYSDDNTINEFKKFLKIWIPYFKNVLDKWLVNKNNLLPVSYDSLISDFNSSFKNILYFFNIPVNDEFIEKTKIYVNIEERIKFDRKFYDLLKNIIVNELLSISVDKNIIDSYLYPINRINK